MSENPKSVFQMVYFDYSLNTFYWAKRSSTDSCWNEWIDCLKNARNFRRNEIPKSTSVQLLNLKNAPFEVCVSKTLLDRFRSSLKKQVIKPLQRIWTFPLSEIFEHLRSIFEALRLLCEKIKNLESCDTLSQIVWLSL